MEMRKLFDALQGEEQLLGRPRSLRRMLTISVLIMIGAWVAYVQIDHATQPRHEQVKPLDTVVSEMAVPEPLCHEARSGGERRVFTDFATYDEFLRKHGLADGVLIIRARTADGKFLYDGFPPLRDRNTFSFFVTSLPEAVSGRSGDIAPRSLTRVHTLPARQLSSRPAAQDALDAGIFLEERRPGAEITDSR
jgi:hypothetical protein